MQVVTRFAPSPSGGLHLGGARTALFNWLQARAKKGKFLLRVEDTDAERSKADYVTSIMHNLRWLGLEADEPPVFQSKNSDRHRDVAFKLLEQGKAYLCYATPEELQRMRDEALEKKQSMRYNGLWRDKPSSEAPLGVNPVIRLKTPETGKTAIDDLVQRRVEVDHSQIDDFILLRADRSPTYMLSVVVDDHDMGITQIIRGDDHLTNAFRQIQLFQAMGWQIPVFGHIPLLHGHDGAKLSKRHGALDIGFFEKEGYHPQAILNFLLRLGWGKGEQEIIDISLVQESFDLSDLGRAASKVDFDKLDHINGSYLRNLAPDIAFNALLPFLPEQSTQNRLAAVRRAMASIQQRSRNWKEAASLAEFYLYAPVFPLADQKAIAALSEEGLARLKMIYQDFNNLTAWSKPAIIEILGALAEKNQAGFGVFARPLRAALAGAMASPDLGELAEALGRDEVLKRIETAIQKMAQKMV